MDVVEGEEAGNTEGSASAGDESGHPVVAVNEIGFYGGDDVVDDFALEGEGDFEVNGHRYWCKRGLGSKRCGLRRGECGLRGVFFCR